MCSHYRDIVTTQKIKKCEENNKMRFAREEINEKLISAMCDRYKMKYKIFEYTDIILIESGLDEWKIEMNSTYTKRPVALYHSSKFNRKAGTYHLQRDFNYLHQCLDSLVNHKRVLTGAFNKNYIPYNFTTHNLSI